MDNSNTRNPLEELSKYEKQLDIAKNSGNISEIFHCLLNLGNLCNEIEADELGFKYVQGAIELSKKHSDFPHLYEFYNLLGDFNFKQGLLKEAHDAYKRSKKMLPKKENLKLRAEINFKLGRMSEISNNKNIVIGHYRNAKKIYEKLGLHAEVAKCLNRMGLIYFKKLPHEDEITAKNRYSGNIMDYGTLIMDTASFIKNKADLAMARKYFESAIMILEQNNLTEVESELYKSIKVYLNNKAFKKRKERRSF